MPPPRLRGLALLMLLVAAMAPATATQPTLWIRVRLTATRADVLRTEEETHFWVADTRGVDRRDSRLLIDAAAQTVTTLDKTSGRTTVQGAQAILAANEAMVSRLRRRVRRMSAEAREAAGRLGGDPDMRVTITPTGKRSHVAGYPAREYWLEGAVLASVWIAPALPAPARSAIETQLIHLGGLHTGGTKVGSAITRMGGFPVRMTFWLGDGTVMHTETIQVGDDVPAPATLRRVPATAVGTID